jgi:Protein of unknown function (DUF3105)
VSSRQQEKEARRRERQEKERIAAAETARRRRMQTVGGGLIAAAAVVGVAVALVSGGGGGSSSTKGTASKTAAHGSAIPAPKIADLAAAAKAAGCTVRSYPNFGQTHTTGKVHYKTNPPTSGDHSSVPSSDGIYDPGKEPQPEHYVHSLEHGRVEIEYRPGAPAAEISQLQTLFNEPLASKVGEATQPAYKKLLFENNTGMPYAVAAVAWQHLIGCPTFNPQIFDAIRDFSKAYVDTAPESQAIPFPE